MVGQYSRNLFLFLVAISVGSIGAIGQAYILRHELVDCYPYKVINGDFYTSIANIGIYFAPITAIFGGILLGTKKSQLAISTPVVLCPLLFSFVFFFYSEIKADENFSWHFDGKTSEIVIRDFFFYSVFLSLLGLFISGICGFILYRYSLNKKEVENLA